MVQLSNHFSLQEFGGGMIPAQCIPAFGILCAEILEPIREYVGGPLYITSGYRSPADNTTVHGIPNSEHMATADWCACDFFCNEVPKTFDWCRNNPTLPYHQLILEKGKVGHVIHISFNRLKPGMRAVHTGATNNREPYQTATFVAYKPEEKA